MKKTLTYIAALAALLAISCNRAELDGNNEKEGAITISLSASDLETRADAQTAAEAKIDHFDYFFFANSDGTGLITSDRVTGTTKTFDTTREEYKALAGKSYLYVIANYPKEIPSTTATTLQDLRALPVQVEITAYPSTPFVMDSYDADKDTVLIELQPTAKNEVRNQVVKMRRVAAKFVVNITVAASVNTGTSTAPVYWKPTTTTKDFYIYLVNSFIDSTSTGALVSGAPIDIAEVTDPTKFYTYNHKHTNMTQGEDILHWTSADYYSYPFTFASDNQKAPYFKIQIPWVNVKDPDSPATGSNIDAMGTHMFYYKVMLPEITTITRNTLYTLNVTLDKVGGTQEDYVIVTDTNLMVTNWLSPSGQFTGYYSARFLDCARDVYEFYSTNSLNVPVTSSHPIRIMSITATNTKFDSETGVETHPAVTNFTTSTNGKSSFTINYKLHNDIDDKTTFNYTPIEYDVVLAHADKEDDDSMTETVKVIQYPPIRVARDLSNGYAYVNSYSYKENNGGRYDGQYSYNNHNVGSYYSPSYESLGVMNQIDSDQSLNKNGNQYVVTVSVLPEGYTSSGIQPIIGDPRGGTLAHSSYLGYTAGTNGANGSYSSTELDSYNAVSDAAKNVIAPQIRIASSWGATTVMTDYDLAEERCAAYQENGYPAGRWRVPTVAEIDFLIKLSNNGYIPPLFTTTSDSKYYYERRQYYEDGVYYGAYWANGPSVYAGKPYTDDGHTYPYENGVGTVTNDYYQYTYSSYYQRYVYSRLSLNKINNSFFDVHVRCVYDQWYWGEEKYNASGEKITDDMPNNADKTPAERWIGYIY